MPLWLKTPPLVGDDGQVIKGGMFPHQRRWWESTHYMRALVGGYGSGKTLISAKRAIAVALHNAPSPYLYVSPSYKLAQRTIVTTLKLLLDGRGFRYTHNKTDNEFVIYHKGRKAVIWVASGDDPDALKGPNIGAANIDEPFIQSRDVFDQIMARVRDPRARHREITMTGTPEELNWGYEICEGEEAGKYDLEVIHASTMDNLTLPEQYIQSLLNGYDEQTIKAYMEGKFVLRSNNTVYYNYDDENHTTKEFNPGKEIHWTHDFNFVPLSSAIIQTEGESAYVVDEIILDHAVAVDAAKEFCERYKGYEKCPVTIYGDSSGRVGEKHGHISDYIEIEQYLRNKGFTVNRRVPLANPSIKDGQNSLRAKILNANGERTFFVNPEKAPTVDRGLKTVQHKAGSTFQEDETNNAQHVTTALRYFTNIVYPITGRGTLKVR